MSAAPISSAADAGRAHAQPAATAADNSKRATDAQSSARHQLNVQILEASSQVAVKAGNDSQALVFRAAIDRINEFLAPTLGPDALQASMGQDNSPEATAERIVSFATGMFGVYAAQRPNDDPDQVAADFVKIVRGGFEKGYNEARDILQGLQVLGGDVEKGIGKTFELVQKGFDDFLAGRLQKPAEA